MRENTESPVHVYQEIDTYDTVDYDVVKSDQGDQLERDILDKRQEWLIWDKIQYSHIGDSVNPFCICQGMEWIVDVLIIKYNRFNDEK